MTPVIRPYDRCQPTSAGTHRYAQSHRAQGMPKRRGSQVCPGTCFTHRSQGLVTAEWLSRLRCATRKCGDHSQAGRPPRHSQLAYHSLHTMAPLLRGRHTYLHTTVLEREIRPGVTCSTRPRADASPARLLRQPARVGAWRSRAGSFRRRTDAVGRMLTFDPRPGRAARGPGSLRLT
eukprot:COSAG02_NODE_1507_length_12231_cov_56.431751_8_plen_177_part_00